MMPDRETASGTEKAMSRNKSADKKREIYRIDVSADSVTMNTHLQK